MIFKSKICRWLRVIFNEVCCIIFLPQILSTSGPIALALHDEKAWQWPGSIGPITWACFTFVNFLAFPDVWIRNFGTLDAKHFASKWFFPTSLIFLLMVLIPVLALGCFAMENIQQFDRQYDVQRSYFFFKELFLNSSISELSKLFVAASFVSVFITTIDTWLIGVLQYSYNINFLKSFNSSSLLLFSVSIITALIGNYIPGSAVYIVGLFVFPFLFLNALLFFSKINDKLYSYKGSLRYLLGWSSGIIATLIMIVVNYNDVENFAPHIILVGMLSQFAVFFLSPFVIKSK